MNQKEHEICEQSFYGKRLTFDKKQDFYSGIRTVKEFDVLHDFMTPFVKIRWRCFKKI